MIRIANAPCSWGVIERTHEGMRSQGYAQVLNEMQATGYTGTELGDWGFMPTDPALLQRELHERKLSLVASWITATLIDAAYHEASAEAAVRVGRLLAAVAGSSPLIVIGDNLFAYEARNAVAGRVQPEHSMDDEQWQVFVAGVHHIARRVKDETGLHTVFHPHCSTWIEAPHEISKLMAMTDPDLVGLCLDTGHYYFGGGDPVAGLRELGPRVGLVHFKDCDPSIAHQARREGWEYNYAVGQGLFCELGHGAVDFPAIMGLLGDLDYHGWIVVEQDVLPAMGAPKEAALRNRDYLRSIGI